MIILARWLAFGPTGRGIENMMCGEPLNLMAAVVGLATPVIPKSLKAGGTSGGYKYERVRTARAGLQDTTVTLMSCAATEIAYLVSGFQRRIGFRAAAVSSRRETRVV